MSHPDLSSAKNKDLPASFIALKRAARTARQIAVRTGTAIVVQRPGQQVIRITAEQLREMGIR